MKKTMLLLLAGLALVSCSHSSPQIGQVFAQVNRVFDPAVGSWSARLSVFVQATNGDGVKTFDRFHLVHDDEGLFFTLDRNQWTSVERPGEFWVGANGIAFPDRVVPVGNWRVLMVTKAGLRAESSFALAAAPADAPGPRSSPVVLRLPSEGLEYRLSGWVDDYLVWAKDRSGRILSRAKVTGPAFSVPPGTQSVTLYSYDKVRGEGLEAGPFSVKASSQPADR